MKDLLEKKECLECGRIMDRCYISSLGTHIERKYCSDRCRIRSKVKRFFGNPKNKDKKREYHTRYILKYPDREKILKRIWYLKNKDKQKTLRRIWYLKHKDNPLFILKQKKDAIKYAGLRKKYRHTFFKNHPSATKEYLRRYKKKHRARLMLDDRIRAKYNTSHVPVEIRTFEDQLYQFKKEVLNDSLKCC